MYLLRLYLNTSTIQVLEESLSRFIIARHIHLSLYQTTEVIATSSLRVSFTKIYQTDLFLHLYGYKPVTVPSSIQEHYYLQQISSLDMALNASTLPTFDPTAVQYVYGISAMQYLTNPHHHIYNTSSVFMISTQLNPSPDPSSSTSLPSFLTKLSFQNDQSMK